MNILIPYSPEIHKGMELRYALRSIEKYLKGYGDVYLIGDRFPSWLKNVNLITMYEESVKSPRNIINKLLKASELFDRFVRWDDDIFLTRPLNVEDIKNWYDGDLSNAIARHHGRYKEIIINTALKLTDSERFYDVHAPMIVYKRRLLAASNMDWSKPLLTKTTCCHFSPWPAEQLTDVKIHGPHSKEDIKKRIGLFFSTSPQAICPTMLEVFNELYPEKSKYEV